jgi:hypothetical protein
VRPAVDVDLVEVVTKIAMNVKRTFLTLGTLLDPLNIA